MCTKLNLEQGKCHFEETYLRMSESCQRNSVMFFRFFDKDFTYTARHY